MRILKYGTTLIYKKILNVYSEYFNEENGGSFRVILKVYH